MSFLNMRGGKPVSNTRSTPLAPSKLRNEIGNGNSTVSRNDGTPTKAAKLKKPAPVKSTFKPAPKPLQNDHSASPLWLERPVMVKPNGTAVAPSSKPRPPTSTAKPVSSSPSPKPSPSRGTPTYISPELRSADHSASRARLTDLFSSSGSSVGHDNAQSDSAAALQSRSRVKTLREVGTLGSPKADGRMDPGRVNRYVPNVASSVTTAYSTEENWVSTMKTVRAMSMIMDERGIDSGSDFMASFLKLESDSGSSSNTLITRASSGVLPIDEFGARSKTQDKALAPTHRSLDRSSKSSAERTTSKPALNAASVERHARSTKLPTTLTPDDSISNFGDSAAPATSRSARPAVRATKSHEKDDERVAFRTYAVDTSLRQPHGKAADVVPRRENSVPSVVRTSTSEDDLRGKRAQAKSKTATPTSNSIGRSSRVPTASSHTSSASSLTSGFTPMASSFPDAPQFDAAAVTSMILKRFRTWLPQLGSNIDPDELFKTKRKEILKNGVSSHFANEVALNAVIEVMSEAVKAVEEAKARRTVPPSPRSASSTSKTGTTPRTVRK